MHTTTIVFAVPELMAEQTGIEMIQLSWNESNIQTPDNSYHLTINSTSNNNVTITFHFTSAPFNICIRPGVYSMQLVALSQTDVYEILIPVEFTVKGKSHSISTLITTFTYLMHRNHATRCLCVITDSHSSHHILGST